jgi:hypothetical protein
MVQVKFYLVRLGCKSIVHIFKHENSSCRMFSGDIIKLAQVIIFHYFLERYTVVRAPIHGFFFSVGTNHITKSNVGQVELQYSFNMGCRKSCLEHKLKWEQTHITISSI